MYACIAIASLLAVALASPAPQLKHKNDLFALKTPNDNNNNDKSSNNEDGYILKYSLTDPKTTRNRVQVNYLDGAVIQGAYALGAPDGAIGIVSYNAVPSTGIYIGAKHIPSDTNPHHITLKDW